jgi:hypothetical protein
MRKLIGELDSLPVTEIMGVVLMILFSLSFIASIGGLV